MVAAAPDNLIGPSGQSFAADGVRCGAASSSGSMSRTRRSTAKPACDCAFANRKPTKNGKASPWQSRRATARARSLLSTRGWPPQASMTARSFGRCSRAAGLPTRGCPIGRWRRSSKLCHANWPRPDIVQRTQLAGRLSHLCRATRGIHIQDDGRLEAPQFGYAERIRARFRVRPQSRGCGIAIGRACASVVYSRIESLNSTGGRSVANCRSRTSDKSSACAK
jgi:hypothetical protein